MTTATALKHPEPFGIAAISTNLNAAKAFYTAMYPYDVMEGEFAGIPYFSIMKDGVTLVNVFEKSDRNPITGMTPILKVDSVADAIGAVQARGAALVIPEATCPCTMASFALCSDPEGNQFILKEASR